MNSFSFCRDNYGTSSRWSSDEETVAKAEDAMWADVATYLRILARNGRNAIVSVEDGGLWCLLRMIIAILQWVE